MNKETPTVGELLHAHCTMLKFGEESKPVSNDAQSVAAGAAADVVAGAINRLADALDGWRNPAGGEQ